VRAALTALVLLAGCGGAATAPTVDVSRLPPNGLADVERLELGRGDGAVVVYRPRGAPRRPPGVLFLHGWGATDPVAYGRWIVHLVRAGNEVVYPRYQRGVASRPDRAFDGVVRGVITAMSAAPVRRGSLVVAGHSAGGAMAADYAAAAARIPALPRPRAVFSVYPGRRIPGIPIGLPEARGDVPRTTRVVALAGARDSVVGTSWAQRIARRAHGRYVLVTDPLVADHAAPQRFDAHARRAFWRPLDRLIRRARAN
jgi:hypothetical protein